jgi:DNA-binding LytR/AlgR family response regulator
MLRNPPNVVFTTAYAEYAARAFDLKAVDYLVKPITEERFKEAAHKVERLMTTGHTSAGTVEESRYVFLKQDNRLVKVLFDDILYVEALKDFSKVFLGGKAMLISAHLKMMEDQLPSSRFLRIHRSYLVALDKIDAVQGNTVEINKQEIPIGNTYKEELMKRLKLG